MQKVWASLQMLTVISPLQFLQMYTLLFFLCRNENTDCTYIQPLRKSESAYGTRCRSYSGNRHHRYLYPKAESFTGSMATYSEKELKTVGNQNVLQSLKVLDPSFIVLETTCPDLTRTPP